MDAQQLEILRTSDETPLDRTLTLAVPPPMRREFLFVPGQHLFVRIPEDPDAGRSAYSLSGGKADGSELEITVRRAGAFGTRLHALETGAGLLVAPPRGRLRIEKATTGTTLLLAGGSGVAPYRAFVSRHEEAAASAPVVLVVVARAQNELLFDGYFRTLAEATTWFRYVPFLSEAAEAAAWTQAGLDALVGNPTDALAYAVGPTAWVEAASAAAEAAGVPNERIVREKWG